MSDTILLLRLSAIGLRFIHFRGGLQMKGVFSHQQVAELKPVAACVMLAAACLTNWANAAAPPPKQVNPIEEIVVSEHRVHRVLPSSSKSSLITQADIADSLSRSLTDLLAARGDLMFVDTYGDGTDTLLSLRGYGGNAASNTLVVIDGRELNPRDIAAPDLNSIHIRDIEAVEILHGPASVAFGDQAVGGLLNIRTLAAGTNQHFLSAGLGSFGANEFSVVLDPQWADSPFGPLGSRLSLKQWRSDGFRDRSDFRRRDGLLRLSQENKLGQWDSEWQWSEQKQSAPGPLSANQRKDDPTQSPNLLRVYGDTKNARLSWRRDFVSTSGEIDLFWSGYHSQAPSTSLTFGNSLTLIDRELWSIDPRWLIALGASTLVVGIDADHLQYRFDNQSVSFGVTGSRQKHRRLDVYVNWITPLTNSVGVEAGVRRASLQSDAEGFSPFGDINEKLDESATAAHIGAYLTLSDHYRMSARIANSFRFPKADEQVSVFSGLNLLRTQQGQTFELNWRGEIERLNLALSAYYTRTKQEIDFNPIADFFGNNVNLANTKRRGLELDAHYALSDTTALGGQAQWIDADLQGEQLPFVASRSAALWLSWQPTEQWLVRWQMRYVGPRYAIGDFANAERRSGGYPLQDLAVRYRFGDFTIAATVTNLLDRAYDASLTFSPFVESLRYQPGIERAYHLELNYEI